MHVVQSEDPVSAATTVAVISPDEALVDVRVAWVEGDGTPRSGIIVDNSGLIEDTPVVEVAPDEDPENTIVLPLDILSVADIEVEDEEDDEPADQDSPDDEGDDDSEDDAEDDGESDVVETPTPMAWGVVADHPQCDGGDGTIAVVGLDEYGEEVSVDSCHPDEESALARVEEILGADAEGDDSDEAPTEAEATASIQSPKAGSVLVDVEIANLSELERAAALAADIRSTLDLLSRISGDTATAAASSTESAAGEAEALVDDDSTEFTPIRTHTTATDDGEWDGPANETNVESPNDEAYFADVYAWRDDEADTSVKAAYRFIHHFVSEDGDPGAASTVACSTGIGVLNGGRGGTTIPVDERQGVYEHLARHLRDADREPPELLSQEDYEAALAVTNAELAAEATDDGSSEGDSSAEFTPVRTHSTSTSDDDWDGGANESNVRSPEDEGYYANIYGWRDSDSDPTVKSSYSYIHHFVSDSGAAGAASTAACSGSISVLNGGRGGDSIPAAERKGVYDHMARHLRDADREPPELMSQDAYEAALAIKNAELAAAEDNNDIDDPEEVAVEKVLSDVSDDELIAELARRFADDCIEKAAAEGGDAAESFASDDSTEFEVDAEADEEVDGAIEATDVSDDEWEAVLIVEGILSGDRRMVEEGALTWRDLPLPLMLQTVNADGHDGAIICGSIRVIERDGQEILGAGKFDSGAAGQEAKRLVSEGTMRGVSADIDSVVVEFRSESGEEVPFEDVMFGGVEAIEVLVAGRLMGLTITPFPAFQEAHVTVIKSNSEDPVLVASGAEYRGDVWRVPSPVPMNIVGSGRDMREDASLRISSLVASASAEDIVDVPARPPAAWFEPGEMTSPVPFTIHPDGRCYGLVAEFGTCHIGYQGRECIDVPRSASGYKHFRNKSVLTAEGALVATGPIFMDTVHPSLRLKASDAQAHYHDTGCAFADVALYENEFGIVAAGALRPGLTEAQVRRARGSDVSPDWRTIKGDLEVVGLLSVNVSGFVVKGLVASGAQVPGVARGLYDSTEGKVMALVAAGMVHRSNYEQAEQSEVSESLNELADQVTAMRDAFEEFVLTPAREARLAEARQRLGLLSTPDVREERMRAALENLGISTFAQEGEPGCDCGCGTDGTCGCGD